MGLTLLVILVVGGIAAIVLAVHLTGGSRTARLADAAQARARFAEDFPDHAVRAVRLAGDGETAFLALGDGRTGIVQAFGDRFLTRVLAARDIAGLEKPDAVTVSVRLRDFTWTGGRFRFADPADADAVFAALDGLRSAEMRTA